VHAASGKRLGASHPREEGPTDLRLVPPALAAWVTAAVTVGAPSAWVTGAVVVCLVAGVALLLVGRRGTRAANRRGAGRSRSWRRVSVAAVLLCAAAAAASAGLHGADLRRGPVPSLARQFATVTAEVEITSDPRLTRPRIKGDHMAPTAVLLDAEVRRVTREDGTEWATRTPVLVIIDAHSPRGSPRLSVKRSPWLSLLPSTRLRVPARLVPALSGGDDIAAVLRVRGSAPPVVVGEPSGPQRFAGRLREGLRKATDGLSADARALLPGLVVGDTSRVTPELDDAFKATDLTHLLAVSGGNFTILLALFI
jgi:competence protein ComEC